MLVLTPLEITEELEVLLPTQTPRGHKIVDQRLTLCQCGETQSLFLEQKVVSAEGEMYFRIVGPSDISEIIEDAVKEVKGWNS